MNPNKTELLKGIIELAQDMLIKEEPPKPKFKVGDRVKIKTDLKNDKDYGDDTFVDNMEQYKGQTTKIKKVYDNLYDLEIDNGKWNWTDEMLEPAFPINHAPENKNISEYSVEYNIKDATTTCIIYANGKTYTGKAKCNPCDTWDEKTGRDIAFYRADIKVSKAELERLTKHN